MANKKTSDYAALPGGLITDTWLFDIANPGVLNYKGTALELKNYVGTGQEGFDATVGSVGSGADYNDIQTAIAAAKYNLLVVGDFTQPTNVTSNTNLLTLTIAEKLRIVDKNFAVGSGGVKVRRGSFVPLFSGGINKLFTSAGLATLDIEDCFIDLTASLDPAAGIAAMFSGSQHKIHNCKIALANSADCGFLAPGASSSFTNLDVIGAGSSCESFITSAEDTIISDINISGTVKTASTFIGSKIGTTKPPILSNILSVSASEIFISLTTAAIQLSNITGRISLSYEGGSGCIIANCNLYNLSYLSGTNDNNFYSNVRFTGVTAISIPDDSNLFVNCNFNPAVTLTAASSGNQFIQCESVGGFTDSGTNNSINLTNINSAGMLTGGAITDAGGETIDSALGSGYLRITNSHTGILKQITWPASAGIAIPTDTVRYVGIDYNAGSPIVIIKTTDTWNRHTEFRTGSVVNESGTLRILNNPWMVANAEGHAIERFFETLPFKRADRIGGLIIGETGTRQVTLTAGEIYDLTNEFPIAAIDTAVSGGFDTYLGLTIQAAAATQWDNLNYNNAGVLTALGVSKWGTLWWYLEADGNLVMNYGIDEHNTQAGADLEPEPPVRPVRIQVHGTLIGRTIFQQNAGTGDFQSAFITQFAGAGSSDHTQLSNLTTGDAGHTQFLMRDGSKTMTGDLNMTGTGGLKVAAGTTAQRPTPVNGHHRYNSTTNLHEFYQNGAWVNYASGPGPGILDKQNIIYRNGAGNDSNSGKNDEQPKLTIGSAITAAIAQSPSSSNMITIKDLGGARISENVTVPSWVILDMSDAEVIGQVTLGVTMAADSHFYFNKASPEAGSECIRISGTGTRYIRGNSTGAALNSTFIVAGGGAVVYMDIVNANAVATGAKFFSLTTGAVLFLNAQTFRETVASTRVGATVFRNVVDDGANADTTNINETGNQIIRGKDKLIYGTSVADVLELYSVGAKWLTNPHFIAYNNAQIPNVTGDGTVYPIVLGQVDENIGNHYNPATGVFTAPTTGSYNFKIVLVLTDMSAAFSDVNIRVVRTGTAATWYLYQSDPDKDIVGNYLIRNGAIDLKLNAGDTIKFQVQVVGGTKVVNVEQGTTFSGTLLTKT